MRKAKGAMGAYLDDWYGDDLVVLRFACHEGRYRAVGDEGLGSHDLLPPPPGSVEDYFHRTGLVRFIIDLRKASKNAPPSAWLTQPRKFHSIGALAVAQQFQRMTVTEAFDALIYFRNTTPSRPVPPHLRG